MNKNLILKKKIYIFIFFLLIYALLVVYFANNWIIRDHISPSSKYDLEMNAGRENGIMNITYEWTGYREASTLIDYIIVQYDSNSIEFQSKMDNEVTLVKDVNKVLPYLNGDVMDYSPGKQQLVISVGRTKTSDSIKLYLANKRAVESEIEVYYIHVVNLPMDTTSGWIKKIIFKI